MTVGAPPPARSPETVFTRTRLATKSDVGHIHKLIHNMAGYYHLGNEYLSATEESLSATLFNYPPFKSTTVFLLEVSDNPFTPIEESQCSKTVTITLTTPISDPEKAEFISGGENVVVAGFVLFFPNYSSFLGRPGFHLEDLFVREGYRRYGMGKLLFSTVADKAVELGLREVEWTVVDWNVDGIRFYQGMGAHLLPDHWRICRLIVEPLEPDGSLADAGPGAGAPVAQI